MTALTLLHTAEAHRATFDALWDRVAPGAALTHLVRTDWLMRAQGGVGEDVQSEMAHAVAAAEGAVICTCTTLGPVAAKLGAIRIDQPMMAEAAQIGGPILMAYCLDSTLDPSRELLEAELAVQGTDTVVHPLQMRALWPLFEAGERGAFASGIAAEIRQAVARLDAVACVVLAQASMADAAGLLDDLGVPVLASPERALRAALAR